MTTELKKPLGRPRKYEAEPGRIEVRINPERRKVIRHAAIEDGVTLSEWMADAAERKLAARGEAE